MDRLKLSFRADEDELALSAEFTLTWPRRWFVPYDDTSPDPATGLKGVRHGRELSPIREHHAHGTGLGNSVCFRQPEGCPSYKGSLDPIVAQEVSKSLFFVCLLVLFRRGPLSRGGAQATTGIRRVSKDCINTAIVESSQGG